MRKFVAFIPELNFDTSFNKRKQLSNGLFFLPINHKYAKEIRQEIEFKGFKIEKGSYLYFESELQDDLTSYEVFHGYCLAITFFYINGRATCRAIKELGNSEKLHLYIDKFDKFGVDPDDLIFLQYNNKKQINVIYERILPHLSTKDFNALRNSLEFFSLFLRENEIRIRLLYLSICLESLFLEGNDAEGISHKLGMRTAYFLHNFDKSINKFLTFCEVRNGYNLRSKIIHGGDYQKESSKVIQGNTSEATTELDHVLILERILKNVFHFIFLEKDYYEVSQKKTLGQKIDQELVLDKTF